MRHICNRDQQPPTLARALAVDGIVEIARIGAVDRDEVDVTKIDAPFLCAARNVLAEFLDLVAHRARPVRWYPVGMDRDVGRDAFRAGLTDNAHDLPRRLLDLSRVIENLGDDNLARLRAAGFAFGDQDAVRDLRVVGNDNADAALANELPRDLADAALEHLDEIAFGFAAAILSDDLDRNAIAVEQWPHLARREIDVITTVVPDDEPESVAMPADHAGHEVEFRYQAKLAAAVLDDLPGADHAVEPVLEQRTHALPPEPEP